MNSVSADLLKWLDEEQSGLVEAAMKLIRDDAPKNKFSIITGRLLMIEDTQNKLVEIEKNQAQATG